MATIQNALSEWLTTLGYGQMARDVLRTKQRTTLRRYADFVVKEVRKRYGVARAQEVESKFDRLKQLGKL